jgi:transcriptional regulator with XRE-family HTH domain
MLDNTKIPLVNSDVPKVLNGRGGKAVRPAIDCSTFGGRLRAVRRAFRDAQADLAAIVGCSRAAISQWETGVTGPTTEHVCRLLEHYRLPFDWLVAGRGPIPILPLPRSYPRSHTFVPVALSINEIVGWWEIISPIDRAMIGKAIGIDRLFDQAIAPNLT